MVSCHPEFIEGSLAIPVRGYSYSLSFDSENSTWEILFLRVYTYPFFNIASIP